MSALRATPSELAASQCTSLSRLLFHSNIEKRIEMEEAQSGSSETPDDQIQKELYFLIAKFLSIGPCSKTSELLIQELEEHNALRCQRISVSKLIRFKKKLVPKRTDFDRVQHKRSFDEYAQLFKSLPKDYLLRICQRAGPVLNEVCPAAVPGLKFNLLGRGKQSLIRTKTTRQNVPWTTQNLVAVQHGAAQIPPNDIKRRFPLNKILAARELTGAGYRREINNEAFYVDRFRFKTRIFCHLSSVFCISFDRTGRYIFTGADDSLVKVFSAMDCRLLFTFRGSSAEITDLSINHENTMIAAGCVDKNIRVWSLKNGSPVAILQGHTSQVSSLQFLPFARDSSRYLVSIANDGCVCFWRWDVENRAFDVNPIKFSERQNSKPSMQMLICGASAGGGFVATGASDHFVRVYGILGPDFVPRRIFETEGHTDHVDSLQWAHRGLRFASGSRDGTVKIWSFNRQEWKSILLNPVAAITQDLENLAQEEAARPDGRSLVQLKKEKIKITMIGWSLDDTYLVSASGDFILRQWNTTTGALIRTLTGHKDETHVLEANPVNPNLFLSCSHDGRVMAWNLLNGQSKELYYNHIHRPDLGLSTHGCYFDCEWAPDGTMIAAVDSHGQLTILGIDETEMLTVPQEQFFHTDYRPLTRDLAFNVLDEQTQTQPHLMAPPQLVDSQGAPYAPKIQRRVPGKETCSEAHITPHVVVRTAEADSVHVVDSASETSVESPVPATGRGDSTDSGFVSSAESLGRVGTSASVGARANNAPVLQAGAAMPACVWAQRDIVRQFEPSALARQREVREETWEFEARSYEVEAAKPPLPVAPVEEPRPRRRRGEESQPAAQHGYLTRRVRPRTTRLVYHDDDAVPPPNWDSSDSSDSDYSTSLSSSDNDEDEGDDNSATDQPGTSDGAAAIGLRIAGRSTGISTPSESVGVSSDHSDWEEEQSRSRRRPTRKKSDDQRRSGRQPSRRRGGTGTAAAGEANDDDDDEECAADDENSRDSARARRAAKRSTRAEERARRRKAQSAEKRRRRSPSKRRTTEGKLHRIKMRKISNPPKRLEDVSDRYRFPDWLTATQPRKSPYFPQVDDEVVYFWQGHREYVRAVIDKKAYDMEHVRFLPYMEHQPTIKTEEFCRVVEVKYVVQPYRLCCLKLAQLNPRNGHRTGTTFSVKYHDMEGVVDFLVLKQYYDRALDCNWRPEDPFHTVIDNEIFTGQIVSLSPYDPDHPGSNFLTVQVMWSDGLEADERLSLWDLEMFDGLDQAPADPSQRAADIGRFAQVEPVETDWPLSGREAETQRLLAGLDRIMQFSFAESFNAPVDVSLYPDYQMAIDYPCDLNTIKERLSSGFYRRVAAVAFDIKQIYVNAQEYNQPRSDIVKSAKLLYKVLMAFIDDPLCENIVEIHTRESKHQAKQRARDSEEEEDDDDDEEGDDVARRSSRRRVHKPDAYSPSRYGRSYNTRYKRPDAWKADCRSIIKKLMTTEDSTPFRRLEDQTQEARESLSNPLFLETIQTKLDDEANSYASIDEFEQDVRLVLSNARILYPTQRSKYSMMLRLKALCDGLMGRMREKFQDQSAAGDRAEAESPPCNSRAYNTRYRPPIAPPRPQPQLRPSPVYATVPVRRNRSPPPSSSSAGFGSLRRSSSDLAALTSAVQSAFQKKPTTKGTKRLVIQTRSSDVSSNGGGVGTRASRSRENSMSRPSSPAAAPPSASRNSSVQSTSGGGAEGRSIRVRRTVASRPVSYKEEEQSDSELERGATIPTISKQRSDAGMGEAAIAPSKRNELKAAAREKINGLLRQSRRSSADSQPSISDGEMPAGSEDADYEPSARRKPSVPRKRVHHCSSSDDGGGHKSPNSSRGGIVGRPARRGAAILRPKNEESESEEEEAGSEEFGEEAGPSRSSQSKSAVRFSQSASRTGASSQSHRVTRHGGKVQSIVCLIGKEESSEMHILWETTEQPGSKIDQPINWLSWIPADNPDEGYLGVGCQQGIVGITLTDLQPRRTNQLSKRLNFNLRGHHSPISLVEWNRQHRKLASCDDSGIIHVWVQYEDRWTIELVNDRGVKIRDFQWSPNGALVLICYTDSFILVGSVSGQRNWSTQMPENNVLCGTWIPDDASVILGTSAGDIVLVNEQGQIVRNHSIWADHPIEKLAWSPIRSEDHRSAKRSTLCACFRDRGYSVLYFMRSYDDPDPVICRTELDVVRIQWSQNGEYLGAVGVATDADQTRNMLQVYNAVGERVLNSAIPCNHDKRVSAFTFAYDSGRVCIAVQCDVFTGHLFADVPSLQLISSYVTWKCLNNKKASSELPIPVPAQQTIDLFNHLTIQCYVPSAEELLQHVCKPCQWRWYCTIMPEPQSSKLSHSWALCLEHLGGLIPILRGRQVNKFRPEFELRIFTPLEMEDRSNRSSNEPEGTTDDASGDSDLDVPPGYEPFVRAGQRSTIPITGVGASASAYFGDDAPAASRSGPGPGPSRAVLSPYRDSMWRRSKRSIQAIVQRAQQLGPASNVGSSTASNPNPFATGFAPVAGGGKQPLKLVQVTSNVWCTRFKLAGRESEFLPAYLGQVLYKTSVLHLQPRQMTVHLVDLGNAPRAVSGSSGFLPSSETSRDVTISSRDRKAANKKKPGKMKSTSIDSECSPENDGSGHANGFASLLHHEGPPIVPVELTSNFGSCRQIFSDATASGGACASLAHVASTSSAPMCVDPENEFPYVDLSVTNPCMLEETERDESLIFNVMREFHDLKCSVDGHITRMREFAADMQRSGNQLSDVGFHSAQEVIGINRMLSGSGRGEAPSRSSSSATFSAASSASSSSLSTITTETVSKSLRIADRILKQQSDVETIAEVENEREPSLNLVEMAQGCQAPGGTGLGEPGPTRMQRLFSSFRRGGSSRRFSHRGRRSNQKNNGSGHASVDHSPVRTVEPPGDESAATPASSGRASSRLSKLSKTKASPPIPPHSESPGRPAGWSPGAKWRRFFGHRRNRNSPFRLFPRSKLLRRSKRKCVSVSSLNNNETTSSSGMANSETSGLVGNVDSEGHVMILRRFDADCTAEMLRPTVRFLSDFSGAALSFSPRNIPDSELAFIDEEDRLPGDILAVAHATICGKSQRNNHQVLTSDTAGPPDAEIVKEVSSSVSAVICTDETGLKGDCYESSAALENEYFERLKFENDLVLAVPAGPSSSSYFPSFDQPENETSASSEAAKQLLPAAKLKEIVSVLDKLYKLAGELTPTRPSVLLASLHQPSTSTNGGGGGVASKICPSRADPPIAPLAIVGDEREAAATACAELYARIREISFRVAQLENRLIHGNELLEEVRTDLESRVDTIRRALKEGQTSTTPSKGDENAPDTDLKATISSAPEAVAKQPGKAAPAGEPSASAGILTLHNKAPFWNEASQIYQLDFGGRVTQESAKNFQIEFESKQVMQFGRIENNAFTLDFQEPFSAIQAFAVALASITQRLK